eukprot:m.244503 g.244503  ORF g.244503 m.244503 type:complete len:513 (+) comp19038_c1_seq1:430-1968(+)
MSGRARVCVGVEEIGEFAKIKATNCRATRPLQQTHAMDEGLARKAAKEAFVSGCTGTTVAEVTLLICLPAAGWFLQRCLVVSDVVPHGLVKGGMLDVVVAVLPSVMCLFVPYLAAPLGAASVAAGLIVLTMADKGIVGAQPRRRATGPSGVSPMRTRHHRQPFVGAFRSTVLLVTCAAILAVDFPSFPRRLAKTEHVGTSLMDLGVGAMVLSSGTGLVSRSGVTAGAALPWVSALPLAVLGFARLASIKAIGYTEHHSEYGVHWNFFFTLATVVLAYCAMAWVVRKVLGLAFCWQVRLALAGVIATAHQAVLVGTPLQAYALSADGTIGRGQSHAARLVAQNKEGLTSLPGYTALMLAGTALWDVVCHTGTRRRTSTSHAPGRNRMLCLLAIDILLWLALVPIHLLSPPSRRVVNASYIVWTLASSGLLLCLFWFIDIELPHPAPSNLLAAWNKNQLALFLLANVLTGMVNLSLDTLSVSWWSGVGLVLLYVCTLCIVALVALKRSWRLKFW